MRGRSIVQRARKLFSSPPISLFVKIIGIVEADSDGVSGGGGGGGGSGGA